MAKLVVVFSHKGGVGKTSATYCMGHVLAEHMGKRVLLIDADPQCNLTGLIMNDVFQKDTSAAEAYYRACEEKESRNPPVLTTLGDCFRPLTKRKEQINIDRARHVELSPVHEYKNLFFLPGNLSISDMDEFVTLGITRIPLYENIPGIVSNLIRRIAELNNIDLVLIDLSPNLGGFNKAILMGADYFISPYFPDFFSYQAMGSLREKIPQWHNQDFRAFREKPAGDPGHIAARPLFLGAFPQRAKFRHKTILVNGVPIRKDAFVQSYGYWIGRVNSQVRSFYESLRTHGMIAPHFVLNEDIGGVREFNSIGLDVQTSGRPITDVEHRTRHHVDQVKTSKPKQEDIEAKKKVLRAYQKIIGSLFKNMQQEDLASLGDDFRERIALYADIGEQIDWTEVEAISPLPSLEAPPASPEHNNILTNDSWYTDHHINLLIGHYLNTRQDVHAIQGISATDARGEQFFNALQDFKQRRENGQLADKTKIVVPVNLDNNHWVLLYIRYRQQENDTIPEFFYFDPLGGDTPERIKNVVTSLFQRDILNLASRRQHDHYNCGAWVIETAQSLVLTHSLPQPFIDINTQRAEHVGIINAMQPNGHYLRQRRTATQPGTPSRGPATIPSFFASQTNGSIAAAGTKRTRNAEAASNSAQQSVGHAEVAPVSRDVVVSHVSSFNRTR